MVVVVSTTGEGEPPETVGKFWRKLKKKTVPKTHLSGLHYGLLGEGRWEGEREGGRERGRMGGWEGGGLGEMVLLEDLMVLHSSSFSLPLTTSLSLPSFLLPNFPSPLLPPPSLPSSLLHISTPSSLSLSFLLP